MCDFIENPAIQEAVKTKMVPVSMPSGVNSVLKISVWVGLGTVGLWAALDAFAERASLNKDITWLRVDRGGVGDVVLRPVRYSRNMQQENILEISRRFCCRT